jgi:hypothetical protein
MSKLIKLKRYNYPRFKPNHYNFLDFNGPKAGEKFLDFKAYNLENKEVKLSDFIGKPVVLETGSVTCPMYSKNTSEMQRLLENYPDVQFILLYVREAHPGSDTTYHHSLEEKIEQAKRLHDEYHENRLILVDDLHGSAHQLYGGFPNMVYVFNSEGTVIFRGDWNKPKALKDVLSDHNPKHVYFQDHFLPENPNPFLMTKVLLKGGWDALWDMLLALPKLNSMQKNKEISSYYRNTG